MAKRVIHIVTDDIDGSEDATEHLVEVDGYRFAIDLSDPNFDKLMAAIRPYMQAGRRVANGKANRLATQTRPAKPPRVSWLPTQREEIPMDPPGSVLRAWWKRNDDIPGMPRFQTMGPIPGTVKTEYRRQHDSIVNNVEKDRPREPVG